MSEGRVGTVNWLLAALMRLEVEGLGDADVTYLGGDGNVELVTVDDGPAGRTVVLR